MLDAEVIGDDVELGGVRRSVADAKCPGGRRPIVALGARHGLGEIESRHRRRRFGARNGIRLIRFREARTRHDAAVLCALLAQDSRQLARVDVGDADDVARREELPEILRAPPTRGQRRQVANHESRGKDAPRFRIFGIDADVADMGIGQRDDLTGVGRIGKDFLVAGHRGVENDLADRATVRADRSSTKHRSVGQRQQRGHARREECGLFRGRREWRVHRGRSDSSGESGRTNGEGPGLPRF